MLKKYTGDWSFEQAAHLLRRTTFGATFKEINNTVDKGMDASIRQLLRTRPMPDHPVNYYYGDDPAVPINSEWVKAPYTDFANNNARRKSLYGWTLMRMMQDRMSIREKMTLFWQSHFIIETDIIKDAKFLYQYVSMFRSQALGNFQSLVEQVTISPSMLRYLNGRDNTESAPNENYARELLELFTLGKGDLAGPGDYTTFTEEDVIAMAKVLTGWRDRNYVKKETESVPEVFFRSGQHDKGQKQLSHRFDNTVVNNNNAEEYKDLIAIIFQHPQASRFICRRLYRWFVHFDINGKIEQEVIEPMSAILRENDFNIKPVIEALLKSEHFYEKENIGSMVKSPVDFILFSLNQLEVPFPDDNLYRKYQVRFKLYQEMEDMQMEIFNPPNVAGWKAYYQQPLFYQSWISAAPLMLFGSCVRQGFIGDEPEIPDVVDIRDGVAMQYDFRDIYGSVLMDWFGAEQRAVKEILHTDFRYISLLEGCGATYTDPTFANEAFKVNHFPNPFIQQLQIEFESKEEWIRLSIFNEVGKEVRVLLNEQKQAGTHQVFFNASGLPAGNYYYHLVGENERRVTKLVVKI